MTISGGNLPDCRAKPARTGQIWNGDNEAEQLSLTAVVRNLVHRLRHFGEKLASKEAEAALALG